jgi:hypothetical protein
MLPQNSRRFSDMPGCTSAHISFKAVSTGGTPQPDTSQFAAATKMIGFDLNRCDRQPENNCETQTDPKRIEEE